MMVRAVARGGRPVLAVLPGAINAWESEEGPGAGKCFEPPKGWIVPTPTIRDTGTALTSQAQPGTRIYYISNSVGVAPGSGVYYLWDGTNIIDSTGSTTGAGGVAYGTDPMNPTGPIIAWKHWSAVGPCRNGQEVGVRTNSAGTMNPGPNNFNAGSSNREDKPDWWLFKRGDTFDLTDDNVDYKTIATSWAATTLSLMVPGGVSWRKRMVVGAYGPLSTARPIIGNKGATPLVTYQTDTNRVPKNMQYMDLHFFTTRTETTSNTKFQGIDLKFIDTRSFNILFQGLLIDRLSGGCVPVNYGSNPEPDGSNHVVLHRCAIMDCYNNAGDAAHGIGLGPSGAASGGGRVQVSECFLARNGAKGTGTEPEVLENAGTLTFDSFVRNNYWGGNLNHLESWFIDSISLRGGSGDQFRMGVRIENCFFLQGYLANAGYGGQADGLGPTGTFCDNVMQNFRASGSGHPGWAYMIGVGSNDMPMVGNIFTMAGESGGTVTWSLEVKPNGWSGYEYAYQTRRNMIHGNLFESSSSPIIAWKDGVEDGWPVEHAAYVAPGVVDNVASGNWFVTTYASPYWSYTQLTQGPASLDASNTTASNTIYASRAAQVAAMGGTDANYSLKSYLVAQGETVSFGLGDGVQEIIDIWRAGQRRGDWDRKWTAPAINDAFRKARGFGVRWRY